MKPLPMSQGRVVAKGSCEKMMMAVDSSGDAQTISSSEYREFFIPEDGSFNTSLVMVQIATLSGYSPEDNYLPFYWSDKNPETDSNAVIANFPWYGKLSGVSQREGESLGFFKAATPGAKVVLWGRE
jgi:hypothetical protein